MRTPLQLGLAIVVVLGIAAPVAGQAAAPCRDADGNLVLTERQAWIHDAAGTKAGNLAGVGAGAFPSWDDSAPTGSVSEGAGGGYYATSAGDTAAQEAGAPTTSWDERYTATVEGTFDGCLDTMGVTWFMLAQIDPAALNFHLMAARLSAGDVVLVESEPVEVASSPSSDVSYRVPFAFRNLVAAFEAAGLDPSATHELTLEVRPVFSDVGHVAYVWDTTEVPASIEFNASSTKLKAYTALN